MSNGIKKPARVGRTSGCFGMVIVGLVLMGTFMAFLIPGHDPRIFFKMLFTLIRMSPGLAILLVASILLGGGALGRLLGGGRKMGQTTGMADLENL